MVALEVSFSAHQPTDLEIGKMWPTITNALSVLFHFYLGDSAFIFPELRQGQFGRERRKNFILQVEPVLIKTETYRASKVF